MIDVRSARPVIIWYPFFDCTLEKKTMAIVLPAGLIRWEKTSKNCLLLLMTIPVETTTHIFSNVILVLK